MKLTIYHNPGCSKSRQTLELLTDNGYQPDIVEYLDTPPDADTLARLIKLLDVRAADIMRTGEAEYREARDSIAAMNETARIEWLAANPRVIQRPIVVSGERARIGRPPESVLEILE